MEMKNIKTTFYDNGGVIKASKLHENKVSKYEIKKLVDENVIERISKGYYKLTDDDISDIKLISILLPGAIICFDSALFLYGYSDRTPVKWHLAVDKNISKSKVNMKYPYIKPYYIDKSILNIGVEEILVEDVRMKIYSREKLICDCLKYESKMDVEIFNKAIISYIKDPKKNIPKLMEIAKKRKVEKKVYDKIGVWL
ncbi:MAG: type IV toxin-antitoxin system AbiEi family antitoxin domain-containing protein [Clostridia bacterium]|jgi:predicted transcriptional regulator of viral defense system|nr:type IV toxin-antitoxin system AbiEi family antitoxin domain-containing protein [Clostridia bacterium]